MRVIRQHSGGVPKGIGAQPLQRLPLYLGSALADNHDIVCSVHLHKLLDALECSLLFHWYQSTPWWHGGCRDGTYIDSNIVEDVSAERCVLAIAIWCVGDDDVADIDADLGW
jgi:hypothetical protein